MQGWGVWDVINNDPQPRLVGDRKLGYCTRGQVQNETGRILRGTAPKRDGSVARLSPGDIIFRATPLREPWLLRGEKAGGVAVCVCRMLLLFRIGRMAPCVRALGSKARNDTNAPVGAAKTSTMSRGREKCGVLALSRRE